MPDSTAIATLLATAKVIAIVGLSPKLHRASYDVASYLQANAYRVIPINPSYAGTTILGEPCYASLTAAADALKAENLRIDIVNCFRKSADIEPIADEAIAIGATCLWMQQGIVNNKAATLAKAAGLTVIMDNCIKTAHRKHSRSVH